MLQIYKEMMDSLKGDMRSASDYLIRNFAKEFKEMESMTNFNQAVDPKSSDNIFSDGESSLGDSSLNQSRFMFMNSEQFHLLADTINKTNTLEVRKDALKSLLQIPIADVQNNESAWIRIRQGILDALSDSEEVLWSIALKFISRAFTSNSTYTKDIYTILVEFLRAQFSVSNKNNMPKVKNGLDCRKIENIKLLKAFRLMNEFQRQIPQYWVRYTEKFLEEILEVTASLLAIHYNTAVGASTQINPVHFLALIDPQGKWFKHWMHGHYSRGPLLRIIGKHKAIVDNAVKACMDFTSARRVPFDLLSEASETPLKDPGEGGRRMYYTGHEIDYGYFVHSLHLLGGLLCYSEGRKLFPIKLKDREEPVTVTCIVVTLVQLLITPVHTSISHRDPAVHYDPGLLVTELFRKLTSSEQTCRQCVCKDEVTNVLLSVISHRMDSTEDTGHMTETILLQVAEILSMLAASSAGRQHLLYGGKNREKFERTKSSPMHVVAEFAKRGLTNRLELEPGVSMSKAVIGNFVYVCRQLYCTCEGLLVMYPYDIHTVVADSWKEACRQSDLAATPTPSIDGKDGGADRESQYMLLWEDSLRDNLLSLAATPKGLLLLQQANALEECVAYMYTRQSQRLQVSKCEKYGYGYLVSQMSATAPGTAALQKTGYLQSLVQRLWGMLEVIDDRPVYTPQRWSVTTIDKTALKAFNTLANILSFPAIHEQISAQKLPTKDGYSFRDLPGSILVGFALDLHHVPY